MARRAPEEALAALRASLDGLAGRCDPSTWRYALWMIVAQAYATLGESSRAAVLFGARVRIWHDFGLRPGPFRTSGRLRVLDAGQLIEAIGEDGVPDGVRRGVTR